MGILNLRTDPSGIGNCAKCGALAYVRACLRCEEVFCQTHHDPHQASHDPGGLGTKEAAELPALRQQPGRRHADNEDAMTTLNGTAKWLIIGVGVALFLGGLATWNGTTGLKATGDLAHTVEGHTLALAKEEATRERMQEDIRDIKRDVRELLERQRGNGKN